MIKADKEEIKEMLNDAIELWVVREKGVNDIITIKLDAIQAQTTKTNGRVNKAEVDIRDLQDENLKISSVKKWMYKSVSITSLVVSIVWVYVKLMETLIIK